MAALAPNTRSAYRSCLSKFFAFTGSSSLPASTTSVALFVAHLFNAHRAPSSISLHLSALAYIHKLHSYADPTDSFIIKKMMTGAYKLGAKPDARLPITPAILRQIIQALPFLALSSYTTSMLKAMFLLAFFGFLRVGELTIRPGSDNSHVISVSNLQITRLGIVLSMSSFKHNQAGRTVNLHISPQTDPLCPVKALSQYLAVRGGNLGPLFTFPDNQGISRSFFVSHLNKVLRLAKLDTNHYKSHSFRIGAATHAVSSGIPETNIKEMGRWRSSAYKKYIRIPMLSV